jgi:hypothetical protein
MKTSTRPRMLARANCPGPGAIIADGVLGDDETGKSRVDDRFTRQQDVAGLDEPAHPVRQPRPHRQAEHLSEAAAASRGRRSPGRALRPTATTPRIVPTHCAPPSLRKLSHVRRQAAEHSNWGGVPSSMLRIHTGRASPFCRVVISVTAERGARTQPKVGQYGQQQNEERGQPPGFLVVVLQIAKRYLGAKEHAQQQRQNVLFEQAFAAPCNAAPCNAGPCSLQAPAWYHALWSYRHLTNLDSELQVL